MGEETTTDRLAEIEGQAADYTPPEDWRVLQAGEAIAAGDRWVRPADKQAFYALRIGEIVRDGTFIRRIEPQPQPQPEPEPQQAPQAESDFEVRIRVLKQCNDNQAETIGRLNGEVRDLRTELAETEQKRNAYAAQIGHLETINKWHAETISGLHSEIHGLNMEIGGLNRERAQKDDRIGYLETMNAGQATAVKCAGEQNEKLRELADNARRQLEAAADEISELRKSLDEAEKQLDQKDAQIRDLRIELEAAQQVTRPLNDEQREQIWDQATEQAGEQLIRWLRPLTQAMISQPDDRLCRFMAMTLSIFPDVLPHVLGYAEEEQAENLDSEREPE